jgi:pimeloyl-ACP methyl ester carboxylesterase
LLLSSTLARLYRDEANSNHQKGGKDSTPLYIQQGKGDLIIPYLQSMLAEKMKAALGKEHAIMKLVEKVGHVDWGFFKLANINKVIDFLDRYLK